MHKCWLGFKIAHANGDSRLMKEYASIITKIQVEMGISATDFDENILDEETATYIRSQALHLYQTAGGCADGRSPYRKSILKPRTPAVLPSSRDKIFATDEAKT